MNDGATDEGGAWRDEPEPPKRRLGLWIFVGGAVLVVGVLGLGCLATLFVPRMTLHLHQAMRDKANADVEALEEALARYHLDHAGVWPDSLEALVTPDADGVRYLDRETVPLDPWDRPYRYEPPAADDEGPRVYSYGADDRPGGEGRNADVPER